MDFYYCCLLFVCYNYFANEMISNKALQKKNHQENFVKGQPRGANSRYYIFVTHLPMVTSNGKKGVVKSGEGKGARERHNRVAVKVLQEIQIH